MVVVQTNDICGLTPGFGDLVLSLDFDALHVGAEQQAERGAPACPLFVSVR